MGKDRVIKGAGELPLGGKAEPAQPEPFPGDGKDPAKADACTVLFWGGSRFYNKQFVRGLPFLFLMFFLIVLYCYSPRQIYSYEPASARSRMQTKGETLLPDLPGKLLLEVSECRPVTIQPRKANPS